MSRVRVATQSYIVLSVLELIAVARYTDTILWDTLQAPVYILILLSMLVVGVGAMVAGRQAPDRNRLVS